MYARYRNLAVLWVAAIVLNACAGIGFRTDSVQDKIAASQVAVGTAYAAVADMLTAKLISVEDARKQHASLVGTEQMLMLAEFAARGNDLATAEGQLAAANQALSAVNQWLQAHKAKK